MTKTIILGIDPGSRITGYGIISVEGKKETYITCGRIQMKSENFCERLHHIHQGIVELIQTYQPEEAAIEQVFVQRNVQSALKLGQARGAAIVAIAQYGIPISEYTARQVKQSCVGYGNADKNQMQLMIQRLFTLKTVPPSDAADALGIALCHAHHRTRRLLQENSTGTIRK